jgi:hypothetical protein
MACSHFENRTIEPKHSNEELIGIDVLRFKVVENGGHSPRHGEREHKLGIRELTGVDKLRDGRNLIRPDILSKGVPTVHGTKRVLDTLE